MFTLSRPFTVSVALVLSAAAAPLAHAAPLGLTLGSPLVASDTIAIDYAFNSTTHIGVLRATGGIARTIDGTTSIPNGAFTLIANLQVTGTGFGQTVTPINGSLNITGTGHQYLCSSSFINLGFTSDFGMSNEARPQTLEFVFQPTYGQLAGTGPVGIVMNATLSPTYTINNAFFTNSFNNTGLDQAASRAANLATPATAVPVPPAAWTGLSVLATLPLFLRRRKAASL